MPTFNITDLTKSWGVVSTEVIGQFTPFNENHGFIKNLMGFDEQGHGRVLLHPLSDQRLSTIAYTDKLTLVSGQYYKLTIRLKTTTITLNEKTDKVLLTIDSTKPVEAISNPYQAVILSCFERFDNPDSNKVLASLLEEVGRGLYSSKKRMFFELLQNADDLPTGLPDKPNHVHIYVEGCKDYLLIMNNAQPFNEDDVRSVTSAAESTKLKQNKKTGYKGIGFKSVFTDSTKVVIKSGGFTFRFDKQAPIFRNFDELYIQSHPLYKNNSDARAYFLKRYSKNKIQYERIESVPWHLKPLWNSSTIAELRGTAFDKNHNVSIGLGFGETKVNEYLNEFSDLFLDPRFLLFLRNTTRIQLVNRSIRLEAERTIHSGSDIDIRQETEVKLLRNGSLFSTYLIQRISIPINNELFNSIGIDVSLQPKDVAGETVKVFCNSEGEELPIPPKLATFSEIQLHLAAPLVDGKVKAESKKSFSGTSIYTYLPMKEGRIQLPILVSGDFVPSSDREKVQADNAWNHFLFYHIGYQIVEWVARLAESSRGEDYLNLLPIKLLSTGDTDIEPIEAWFNKGFEEALREIPFIATISVIGQIELLKTNQIILNNSSLLKFFSDSFFYEFTGINSEERRLPMSGLDTSVLNGKYFGSKHNIQLFTDEDLLIRISNPNALAIFREHLSQTNPVSYTAIISCLNSLVVSYPEQSDLLFKSLPFIRFGNEVLSWSAIAEQDNYLLLDNRTEYLRQELTASGFMLSDVNIDKTPALKSSLKANGTYLDTDLLLYMKVSSRCKEHPLKPEYKSKLFTFFTEFKEVSKEKHTKSLCLFANDLGICRPLDKLLTRNIDGLPVWLTSYKINEAEFKVLPPSAGKHLVRPDNLFSQLLCDPAILAECSKNLDSRHVSEWVTQLLAWRNREELKTPDSGWSSLPWIYTNDKYRFKSATELWTHEALTTFPAHSVVESMTGWITPHTACQVLIKEFDLRLMQDKLTTGIVHTDKVFSEKDTKLFIQFLQAAGEHSFFKKWQFSIAETGFQLSALTEKTIFSGDETIRSFINTNGLGDVLIPAPNNLADQSVLANLGVITGDALLALLAEKAAFITLAPILTKRADNKLYTIYLQYLSVLSLSSTMTYTDSSPEVHVLRIAHDISDRDKSPVFSSFLKKIILDGQPISAITDFVGTVTIKNLAGRDPYKFSTAELLPNNARRIERIQSALNSFGKCKLISQKFLRDEVFSSKELRADDADLEIHKSTPDFLSPQQLVFLQIHRRSKGEVNPQFKIKNFYNYWHEKGDDKKAWEEIGEYLTLLHDKNLTNSHLLFGLDKYVIDPNYCYEAAESLPTFFTRWADTENKLLFLTELNQGAHGSESPIVRLRRALIQADSALVTVQTRTVSNALLINTLKWLRAKEDDALTTASIDCIRLILKKITWPVDQSPVIPIIVSIEENKKTYRLAEFTKEVVHTWSENWDTYEGQIVNLLRSKKMWVVENDFSVEVNKRIGKLDSKYPVRKLTSDILQGSALLSEPCYETWVLGKNYPIYVIQGRSIPWQVWYDDALVTDLEEGLSYFDESTQITYLTKGTTKSFPLYLPTNFPSDLRTTLFELKTKLLEGREENNLLQPSFAESRTYNVGDEAIQSGRELSDAQQHAVYGEVVQRGMQSLKEDGYDFTNAIQAEIGYFKNVKSPDNQEPIEVYFRSAKGGLLYLNPGLWLRLDEPNLLLVVLYADGKSRYVKSKEALLRGKYNDYVLFRMMNNLQPEATDKVAEQMSDANGHLLFITGSEMHKSLSQEFDFRKSNPSIDSALGDKFDL